MNVAITGAVTLWVLVRGFGNVGGSVTLLDRAHMQAIGTYRTNTGCVKVAKAVHDGLRAGGTDADVLCLPTGLTDPVASRPIEHGR